MSDKSSKITVYLITQAVTDPADIVEEGLSGVEIAEVGTAYSKNSFPRDPDWAVDFFKGKLAGHFNLKTSTARGLLVVPHNHEGTTRYFAIAFGQARHFIRDGVIEERFGLKVVLNSVEEDSLRSIDKTALGSVPKQSREQMSGESAFSSFGFDIEQDLVNSVTGRTKKYPAFGKTITGKDAVALSVKKNVDNIKDLLPQLMERYVSKDYESAFDWVDQIRDVRNSDTISTLNNWLIDRISAGDLNKIWMAPPVVLDWVDLKGFSYGQGHKSKLYDDLVISDLIDTFGDAEITLEGVKSRRIYARSTKTDSTFTSWTAYRCIYAEATNAGANYILNAGKWYEISKDFSDAVLEDFDKFPVSSMPFIPYAHADEEKYNKALAASLPGSACMDMKLIPHGGGKSRIEFCDIKTADNKLVHVKHYGGSSQLSHLFNQGIVSAELFLQDVSFRGKLNTILPDEHKLIDITSRPDPSTHEIVFAIISKSSNALDIPFFSKVTLRNARRRLRAYGFDVTLAKISHAQA